jgi:hypothetical protein
MRGRLVRACANQNYSATGGGYTSATYSSTFAGGSRRDMAM